MKHIKLRIVSVILVSILLIFSASLVIINVMLPRYFEKEAENTLFYERMSYGNQKADGTEAYQRTYMSGSVNVIRFENEKRRDGENFARADAENIIRNYCAEHEIAENNCYIIKENGGHYVFTKFFDGKADYALYIDLQPFIRYTWLLNWILSAALLLVALVMCTIGMRLGGKVEEAQETQQKFFQNASHELKTPLMSIQGYAEGIQAGVIPPAMATGVILEESDRMTELVEELLAISKLDACGLKTDTEICDIRDILDVCIVSMDPIARKKSLTVTVSFSDEPLNILCNKSQLGRAFLNILSNAVRYAKTKIKVTCFADKKNACVRISDDGCGIEKDDMAHIFDRFYTGKSGNTGIGLALTHEIITLHKGDISVYNSNGSIFEIRLPLA